MEKESSLQPLIPNKGDKVIYCIYLPAENARCNLVRNPLSTIDQSLEITIERYKQFYKWN